MITLKSINREKQYREVQLDRLPDKCPICHNGIDPVEMGLCFADSKWLQHVLLCPILACQRLFIARYYIGSNTTVKYSLNCLTPIEPLDEAVSDTIKTISNEFALIFNEAHKAEQRGLSLVAGPGYRKALEFLIKDYVISLHPEKTGDIEKMLLGKCITTFVKNEQIQITASRAAWLGNDETHYVRKWEGKDLKDLKTLIALTVRWIEMAQMTDELLKSMPDGKT